MVNYISTLGTSKEPLHRINISGCYHDKTEKRFGRDVLFDCLTEIRDWSNPSLYIMNGDIVTFKDVIDPNNPDDIAEFNRVKSRIDATQIPTEKIIVEPGNHGAFPNSLFRDKFPLYIEGRPYPLIEIDGDYAYAIDFGSVVLVKIRDVNNVPWPFGMANRPPDAIIGGNGNGVFLKRTWDLTTAYIDSLNKPVIVMTHQGVFDTTIGTAWMEGVNNGHHGYSGIPALTAVVGTLYDDVTGEDITIQEDGSNDFIKDFIDAQDGKIKALIHNHTHLRKGETDSKGKGDRLFRNGCWHFNMGNITKYAAREPNDVKHSSSQDVKIYDDKVVFTRILHEELNINGVIYPKGFDYSDQLTVWL